MSREYDEFLQSWEWQRCTNIMKSRRNHTCENCGSNSRLETHHTQYSGKYKGKYWKYLPPEEIWDDIFQVLCRGCHKQETIKRKTFEDVVTRQQLLQKMKETDERFFAPKPTSDKRKM